MKTSWPRRTAALAAVLALLAGCGGRQPASAPSVPAPAPTATPTLTPASSPATASSPASPRSAPALSWPTGPRTVAHQPAVPPVPVLERVRFATHPAEGFDRIVFDFDHALPGYSIRYVSAVRADPSDRPVTVPGRRILLVVFTPAQAHRDNGTATVSGTHPISLPMVRGYAVAGDFEGHVSIAIGLGGTAGFRTGELPGRVYVDVAVGG
jgi:hypothetical protein